MIERTWEVFARKDRGDPLRHVGWLDAPDRELARVYAWRTYDEESWFEMVVVRRDAIVPVNRAAFAGARPEGEAQGAGG